MLLSIPHNKMQFKKYPANLKKLAFRLTLLMVLLPCPICAIMAQTKNSTPGFSGIPVYPVKIDGKSYNFLLKTSAYPSAIDKKIIDHDKKITVNISGDPGLNNQGISTQQVTVPEITIGNATLHNITMLSADLSAQLYQLYGVHIDGVLGQDLYNQFIWDSDNKSGKKAIYSVNGKQPANNYNQCVYYHKLTTANQFTPIVIENIIKDGKIIPFVLSTDTPESGIDSSVAKNLNLATVVFHGTSTSVTFHAEQGDVVTDNNVKDKSNILENFTFENFPIKAYTFNSSDNPYHLNYLGMDFLSRFDQYRLNPLNGSLCFNHFDSSSKIIVRHLAIRAFDGHVELYSNSNNYLRQSGLQNGDIIVSVNGVSYPTAQIVGLREILNYTPQLDLQINRNGEIRHVIIDSTHGVG